MLLGSDRRFGWWPGRALGISLGLHTFALALLVYRPQPPLLTGSASLRGMSGRGQVTTLVAPGVSSIAESRSEQNFRPVRRAKQRTLAVADSREQAAANANLKPGMPGFILGSLTSGWALDHDVHVAVPVDAPDPPIARSKLPDWMRGEVIVEVTIDEKGNVVATNVLHTMGFGIDEIIVATVRNWRYRPARVDGMPVASREDVHFHFPT